jgi:hypothetical protein
MPCRRHCRCHADADDYAADTLPYCRLRHADFRAMPLAIFISFAAPFYYFRMLPCRHAAISFHRRCHCHYAAIDIAAAAILITLFFASIAITPPLLRFQPLIFIFHCRHCLAKRRWRSI